MNTIEITTDVIQLNSLLKLAGAIDTGGQIRFLLDEQRILTNGAVETAKRRQIHPGDIIEILAGEDGIQAGQWKVVRQGE